MREFWVIQHFCFCNLVYYFFKWKECQREWTPLVDPMLLKKDFEKALPRYNIRAFSYLFFVSLNILRWEPCLLHLTHIWIQKHYISCNTCESVGTLDVQEIYQWLFQSRGHVVIGREIHARIRFGRRWQWKA